MGGINREDKSHEKVRDSTKMYRKKRFVCACLRLCECVSTKCA